MPCPQLHDASFQEEAPLISPSLRGPKSSRDDVSPNQSRSGICDPNFFLFDFHEANRAAFDLDVVLDVLNVGSSHSRECLLDHFAANGHDTTLGCFRKERELQPPKRKFLGKTMKNCRSHTVVSNRFVHGRTEEYQLGPTLQNCVGHYRRIHSYRDEMGHCMDICHDPSLHGASLHHCESGRKSLGRRHTELYLR
jgi:hypothetical protein